MNLENSQCRAQHARLVVVDIQDRLGAAMPSKVLKRVVENTSLLAVCAGLMGVPVIRTEQYPKGLGPTNANVARVLPGNTQTFIKTSFSCCGADGFVQTLSDGARRQIVITGMEAHVCVLQTAFDLHHSGFEVFVVEDAVCSRRLENYQNALERLRQWSVNVVSAESVIFEWLGDSGHEHFRTIQGMLR